MSALLLAAALLGAGGDDDLPVRYEVRLDDAAKRWRVRATIPWNGGDLEFWIPRWTAGAYHLAEYGQFVEELRAVDGDGAELQVARDGKCRFVVAAGGAAAVTIDYVARPCAPSDVNENMILQVEGNRIAPGYAFVSPNSLLGFARGLQERPCQLRFELPEGWRVASALPAADDGTLLAPSWWRLEDSPALMSPTLATAPFEVDGVPHWVTLQGGDLARAEELAGRCRRLVEAGRDWMQGLPYDRYHFLLLTTPGESGAAGLEHRASTLIVADPGLAATREYDHLIAHEYFHLWCAERIQVEALLRPDYTQPLRTGTIWVNEGITEYFCRHLMVRAGLQTRAEFFAGLSDEGRMARMMWRMAGDRSWSDVSRDASGWDDMGDLLAFSAKHYQCGCWTMLGLDLEMRAASKGERGVADLLRYLMRAYAERGRGFGEEEMRSIVAGIAQADLDPFFERHVDGPDLPSLKERLAVIGYTTKGGMQEIVPLSDPTPEQRAALEDFFTPPPAK